MEIKSIIFDFGFTLFYFKDPSIEKYFNCFKEGLEKCVKLLKKSNILEGDTAGVKLINLFNKHRRLAFKQSIETKIEYPTVDIFKTVLKNLYEQNIIQDISNLNEGEYKELGDIYHSVEEDMWTPFPVTEKTLKRLKNLEDIKLAVLSNHPHHISIKRLLKKYDLLKYFDVLVTSAKFGKRKPHPEIFHHTLEKMGLSDASTCMMCGDEYADIIGGHRAGLKTILCQRLFKFPYEKEINLPVLLKINDISEIFNHLL